MEMEMEVEMKWEWDGKGKEAVGGYQPREGRTLGAVIRYFGKGKPGARDQPLAWLNRWLNGWLKGWVWPGLMMDPGVLAWPGLWYGLPPPLCSLCSLWFPDLKETADWVYLPPHTLFSPYSRGIYAMAD